jgi:hypothetical protein
MDTVLNRLALDVPYRSGPQGWTDLHAGGLFFCVVYRECLQFSAGGRAKRWCEVIDDSRPLDDEVEQLRQSECVGTYGVNDRGYLVCSFPDLELTGLPCAKAPELLAFHAWRPSVSLSFSLVYRRGGE